MLLNDPEFLHFKRYKGLFLGIVVPFEFCGESFSFPNYFFIGTFNIIDIKEERIDRYPMFTRELPACQTKYITFKAIYL